MERLTQWIDKKAIPRVDLRNCGYEKCATQLARYEDTDLTPEQITSLKKRDTVEMAIITGDNHAIGCKVGTCPKCDAILMSYMGFCYECGQRLDWEEL